MQKKRRGVNMSLKLDSTEKLIVFTKEEPQIRKLTNGWTYIFTDIISISTEKNLSMKSSLLSEVLKGSKGLDYKIVQKK